MKNKWVFLSLVCVAVISSSAFGTIATTSQTWTFSTESSLTADQPDGNTYGNATAAITAIKFTEDSSLGLYDAGWQDYWNGRRGVWIGDILTVALTIPNSGDTSLDSYKEITLKMGFRGYFINAEGTAIDTSALANMNSMVSVEAGTVETLSWTVSGTGWLTLTAKWLVEPNPTSEIITFSLHNSGAYVDYITVDTICIPEPATMTLLGLGGIVSLIARKK